MGVVHPVSLTLGVVGRGGLWLVAVAFYSSPSLAWCHGRDPRGGSAAALTVAAGRFFTSRSRSSPCCRQRAATVAAARLGEALSGGLGDHAVKLEDLSDQEQYALCRSELLLDREVGDRCGLRHGHDTVPLVSPEVKFNVGWGRRNGDGGYPGDQRARPAGLMDRRGWTIVG